MKISKFLLLAVAATALAGCGKEEKVDATLYHLTLEADGVTLTEEQKLELKATYGYGPESDHVVEGVRDPDEIAELKKAGASDADIEKAGKRQEDGSYYFFDGDPIYLEAPAIEGYKMDTFLNGNQIAYRTFLQTHWEDGSKYLPRYNMDNKDTVLKAKYEKWTYTISYDKVEGVTNPNDSITSYCFIDQGRQTIKPAIVTDKNTTFKGWAYQDIANADNREADLIMLEQDGDNYVLPSTYYESDMRLIPVIENAKFNLEFEFAIFNSCDFEGNVDCTEVGYDQAGINLSVYGNLVWVDEVKADNWNEAQWEPIPTPVNKDSDIVCEYHGASAQASWVEVFPEVTGSYKIRGHRIVGEKDYTSYNDSLNYFSIEDVNRKMTVTILLDFNF